MSEPGATKPDDDARLSRRRLIGAGSAAIAGAALSAGRADAATFAASLSMLKPIEPITNPLAAYPNRDWEHAYHDLYTPDSTFHYLVRAERHPRLPAEGERQERCRRLRRPVVRLQATPPTCTATTRRGGGIRVRVSPGLPMYAGRTATAASRAATCGGLQEVDRRWHAARRRRSTAARVPARPWQGGVRQGHPRGSCGTCRNGVHGHRQDLQRRGGRGSVEGAGLLRAGDDRGDARRRVCRR